MKRVTRVLQGVIALVLISSGCSTASTLWDDCRYRALRSATLDPSGVSTVHVQAFSGSLSIQGRPDLTEIQVTGTACAFEEASLEGITIKTERQAGQIIIEAALPPGRVWEGLGRLDLTIEAPSSLRFDVVDGSGEMEIADVASLKVDDGSGPLYIARIGGDVDVKDGGGDLDIEDVRGHVKIDDGRGDVSVRDIGGNVTMTDRNGDVSVQRIRGDFALQSDTKGDVSHSDIGGRISILGKNVAPD